MYLPDIEFRFVMVFGLAGLLLTWIAIWVLVLWLKSTIYARAEDVYGAGNVPEDATKVYAKFKRVWKNLLIPGILGIVLVWGVAVAWTGWRATPTPGEPQGEIQTEPGKIEYRTPSSSPEVAGERVKGEGNKIQREGLEDLDDWRRNFFEKRSGSDEKADESAAGVGAVGDVSVDGGVRDGGSSGQEDHSDASGRDE